MASSLGFFFRKYPGYFSSFKDFVFGQGETVFNNYIKSLPEDLNNYINNRVLPEQEYSKYHDFKWLEESGWEDEKLSSFVIHIRDMALPLLHCLFRQ